LTKRQPLRVIEENVSVQLDGETERDGSLRYLNNGGNEPHVWLPRRLHASVNIFCDVRHVPSKNVKEDI
jgi:hypothetical protein